MNEDNQTIAKNIETLKEHSGLSSYTKLAKKSHVSVPTITNFVRYPNEKNMSLNILSAIAEASNVSMWMILMKDFPFDKSKEHAISTISPQGYTLLHVFEGASEEAKIAILDQVEFLIKKYDNDNKKSDLIANERASYTSPTKKP